MSQSHQPPKSIQPCQSLQSNHLRALPSTLLGTASITPPSTADSEAPLLSRFDDGPIHADRTLPTLAGGPDAAGEPGVDATKCATEATPLPSPSTTASLYQPPTSFCDDPENDVRNTPRQAPWKYVGYRIFSRWLASDSAFLMVRRFGALNARVALSMQDEIVQLEKDLDGIDNTLCQKEMDWRIQNGSFREDASISLFEDRDKLVKKTIPDALTRYNAFINGYTQLVNRAPIHRDDLATVKKWIWEQNPKAIHPEEAAFINCDEDLIGIQPKSRSWLRNILEATSVLRVPGVRRFFERSPRDRDLIKEATATQDEKEGTRWPNDKRVEGFSTLVIALIGLGMLVGPLWWLAFVNGLLHRLSIITGFIAVFFILVEVATDAGVFNALAAAAAYSAVLMVFLQVIPV